MKDIWMIKPTLNNPFRMQTKQIAFSFFFCWNLIDYTWNFWVWLDKEIQVISHLYICIYIYIYIIDNNYKGGEDDSI